MGQLPVKEALVANVPHTDYWMRGLRVKAELVPEGAVAVAVFDTEYVMTQHLVGERQGEWVRLSRAIAYHRQT